MNYYKRHIGDYAKKAGHLSILEHGVYTLLMDAYYDREQAPTRQEAVRISRARTPDELAALDAVLADFFTETDGRYVQGRIEQEFVLAEQQAEKNKANGKQGGRPRKPKGQVKESESKAKKTQSVISDNPSESEKNPNPLIHQSTKPLTLNQELSPVGSKFDQFWACQLRVIDKKKCREAWDKRNLDLLADVIIPKAKAYNESIEDVKFCKHPLTWLNGECWNDEILPRQNAPPPKPSKLAQGLETLERMKHGLVQNRNTNGIAEAGFARLSMDSTDGDDSGYGSGLA